MRERSRAVFAHLGNSIRLSFLAAVFVAAFSKPVDTLTAPTAGLLAEHRYVWIWAVTFLSFGLLTLLSPAFGIAMQVWPVSERFCP
jgi:hypothetical protein